MDTRDLSETSAVVIAVDSPHAPSGDACDGSAAADGFVSVLEITTSKMRVVGRCADCCHWSLPLTEPYRDRNTVAGVALHFNEWIVWDWHVRQHQQLHQTVLS